MTLQSASELNQLFKGLFNKAQTKEEFEYCCALLRIQGSEAPGWDPLKESYILLSQTLSFIRAPISPDYKIRLLLLAYCHATEMNFTYDIIANMIQISHGERYCSNWFNEEFDPEAKGRDATYPQQKIARIKKWSQKFNEAEIGNVFEHFLLKDIRNAFNHSSYILHGDELRIINIGQPSKKTAVDDIDLTRVPKIYKIETLIPQLEYSINLVLILISLTQESIRSYKKNKRVPSKLMVNDPHMELELITDINQGLIGFRSVLKKSNDAATDPKKIS